MESVVDKGVPVRKLEDDMACEDESETEHVFNRSGMQI